MHFKNIDHFVNIFNEIEPLGDRQISMHFPKTITQNASAPLHEFQQFQAVILSWQSLGK